jgi:hypothetical protein
MGLLTWAMVPEAWQQYREATGAGQSTSHYTLHDWIHPTLGYALRQITPGQPFAAMFIPLMLAIPGVIIYSKTRAVTWTWVDQLPGLILISLIAAPYGCWAFDLVLLLVVILRVVSRVWDEQNIVIIYIVMSILTIFNLITLISLKNEHSMTNVFLLPVTCLLYIFTELRAGFRDRPQVVLP